MSFLPIINREYFLPDTSKIRVLLSAGLGLSVFMILIIYVPFGFNSITERLQKTLLALAYGGIAFLVLYVGLVFIKRTKAIKGKLWQIIVTLIILQFFAGILSMFFNNVINSNPYFDFFLRYQAIVFMTGILPNCYLILFMESNYYLKSHTINSHKAKKANKLITIQDQNPDKNLTILPDDIIYIQSQDNYIKIEWKSSEDIVKSTMLRATLNSAIAALSSYDSIIQCHRSYLINLNYIEKVKGSALSKTCVLHYSESTIPIARPKIQFVLHELNSKD